MLLNRGSLDFRFFFSQDFEVFVNTNPNTMTYLEQGNSKHRIYLFFITHLVYNLKALLHILIYLCFDCSMRSGMEYSTVALCQYSKCLIVNLNMCAYIHTHLNIKYVNIKVSFHIYKIRNIQVLLI